MGEEEDYEEYVEDGDVDELKAAEEQKSKEIEVMKKEIQSGPSPSTPAPAQVSHDTDKTDFDQEAQAEIDARSVYVGNVDYAVEPRQLADFFGSCGTVKRVTIPGDRNQRPKAFAYIEFAEKEAVESALKLENSEVGGRPIKVARKRTNIAGYARGRGGRGGRGMGGRTRGRGRGTPWNMMGMNPMMGMGMMNPMDMFNMAGYSPYQQTGFPVRGRGGRGGRGRGTRGRGMQGE